MSNYINENEIALSNAVENLVKVMNKILFLRPEERLIAPNSSHLSEIKENLNIIFDRAKCTDVLYTLNTDKLYFGLLVNPKISDAMSMKLLTSSDPVEVTSYQIEFDSKIFDAGLNDEELTATLLFEVGSMIDPASIDELRNLININILDDNNVLYIRNSFNYSQLIIYALKDTLYKISSIMFKDSADDILASDIIAKAKLSDAVISAQEKLLAAVQGNSESFRTPKTIILRWMFMVYQDISHNNRLIKETLKDAKQFTASILQKKEIDNTIEAIDRINLQNIMNESTSLIKIVENKCPSIVNEISLFKSLKQSGLRGIEDDFYEYSIRVKSAESEEEAMFALRGINTRLSILDDYIYNTPEISDAERRRWEMVANNYRKLRDILANKKIINRKQYGVFIDYSQFDKLD